MGFLYYIAGQQTPPTLDDLRRLGVGYAFPHGRELSTCLVAQNGPDEGSGYIAAYESKNPTGFYKDKQTWRRVPSSIGGRAASGTPDHDPRPPIWVGFYTAQKPGPHELAREQMLEGHGVTLGDGREWIIPLARSFADSEGEIAATLTLPTRSKLDDSGKWVRGEVVESYRPLLDIARRWWEQLFQQSGQAEGDEQTAKVSFDFDGAHEAAVDVLRVNYRLSAVEADMLDLLSESCVVSILNAVVDWPGYVELCKKKAAAASASGG